MTPLERLFGVEAKPRWTGSTELVPVPHDTCPRCGGEPEVIEAAQLALFYHGGYGATRGESVTVCLDCRMVLVVEHRSENPRHVA